MNNKMNRLIFMCLLCVCHLSALGQTKIGVTGSATKTDALVEMGDDLGNKKGLVIPRVKLVSINSSLPMSSHIAGMIVYNTDASGSVPNNVVPGFYYNDGSKWVLTNPSTVPNATALETGKVQLAGDLSGTSSSATAPRVSGLQGTAVSATAPTNGQVLAYNGSSWMPTTSVSVVSSTSPIAVASGTSTPVISLNSLGITNGFLAANAVTSDKILDNTIVNGDLAVGTGGIYRGSGALGGATVVTGNANTLSFTSTVTNGFSIDGTTFSVDAANDRVGIGTSLPSTSLHIEKATAGAIRILDGTQSQGRVLTSDENGVGSWKPIGVNTFSGVVPTMVSPYGTVQGAITYLNAYIDLPVGKFFIYTGVLVNGNNQPNTNYASRLSFSSSTSNYSTSGFSYMGSFLMLSLTSNGSAPLSSGFIMFATGVVKVNVTTPIRLYLVDYNSITYGNIGYLDDNGENYIFAIQAND